MSFRSVREKLKSNPLTWEATTTPEEFEIACMRRKNLRAAEWKEISADERWEARTEYLASEFQRGVTTNAIHGTGAGIREAFYKAFGEKL